MCVALDRRELTELLRPLRCVVCSQSEFLFTDQGQPRPRHAQRTLGRRDTVLLARCRLIQLVRQIFPVAGGVLKATRFLIRFLCKSKVTQTLLVLQLERSQQIGNSLPQESCRLLCCTVLCLPPSPHCDTGNISILAGCTHSPAVGNTAQLQLYIPCEHLWWLADCSVADWTRNGSAYQTILLSMSRCSLMLGCIVLLVCIARQSLPSLSLPALFCALHCPEH